MLVARGRCTSCLEVLAVYEYSTSTLMVHYMPHMSLDLDDYGVGQLCKNVASTDPRNDPVACFDDTTQLEDVTWVHGYEREEFLQHGSYSSYLLRNYG
jgi:hypothetical protein